MQTRKCKKCKETKPLEEFPQWTDGSHRLICEGCFRTKVRRWGRKRTARMRKRRQHIKRNYETCDRCGLVLVQNDQPIPWPLEDHEKVPPRLWFVAYEVPSDLVDSVTWYHSNTGRPLVCALCAAELGEEVPFANYMELRIQAYMSM